MSENIASTCTSKKWYKRCNTNPYNRYSFPIVPYFETRKRDYEYTGGFSFKWLFFTAWALDSPSIELGFVADGHWGIGVIGILPYLRWAVTIPIPNKLNRFINKYLTRKPKPIKPHDAYFGNVAVFSLNYREFDLFTRGFKYAHRREIMYDKMQMPKFISVQCENDIRGIRFDTIAFTDKWRENNEAVLAFKSLKGSQPELFKKL